MSNRQSSSTLDYEGARAIGWASIAIGASELLATRKVQELLGLEDTPQRRGVLRILGIRELCHGLAILTDERPDKLMASNLWSRVAGDVLDSALLAKAAQQNTRPGSFAAVAASVAVIGAADLLLAERLSDRDDA